MQTSARIMSGLHRGYESTLGRIPFGRLRIEDRLRSVADLRPRALPYDDRAATFIGGDMEPIEAEIFGMSEGGGEEAPDFGGLASRALRPLKDAVYRGAMRFVSDAVEARAAA